MEVVIIAREIVAIMIAPRIMKETLAHKKIGSKGFWFRTFVVVVTTRKHMAGLLAGIATIGIFIGRQHGLWFRVFGPEQQVSSNKEDLTSESTLRSQWFSSFPECLARSTK